MIRFIIFIILISCNSCGYFFGKTHIINFACGFTETINLMPPEGTDKCVIEVMEKCNLDSKIYVITKGVRSKEININKTGIIFSRDWYSNELILEFVPNIKNDTIAKSVNLRLKITFFY